VNYAWLAISSCWKARQYEQMFQSDSTPWLHPTHGTVAASGSDTSISLSEPRVVLAVDDLELFIDGQAFVGGPQLRERLLARSSFTS
jgi:hypothetical protein